MNLELFKNQLVILPTMNANILRNQYINRFIDTSKDYYIKKITHLKRFSDGFCYTGYLWDCLKESTLVSYEYITSISHLDDVYVFWDIHSQDLIFIDDYWKFGKETILNVNYSVLIKNLEYLPEDLYIFDNTLSWTLVVTHEYVNFSRFCLKSGIISPITYP